MTRSTLAHLLSLAMPLLAAASHNKSLDPPRIGAVELSPGVCSPSSPDVWGSGSNSKAWPQVVLRPLSSA